MPKNTGLYHRSDLPSWIEDEKLKYFWRSEVRLGAYLLNDRTPPGRIVPCIFEEEPYEHVYFPVPYFLPEREDYAWIIAWKLAINWGWYGYLVIAILEVGCGGEGPFKLFCDFVCWVFIIWPCVLFSSIAFLARPRIGEPMLAVNISLRNSIRKIRQND